MEAQRGPGRLPLPPCRLNAVNSSTELNTTSQTTTSGGSLHRVLFFEVEIPMIKHRQFLRPFVANSLHILINPCPGDPQQVFQYIPWIHRFVGSARVHDPLGWMRIDSHAFLSPESSFQGLFFQLPSSTHLRRRYHATHVLHWSIPDSPSLRAIFGFSQLASKALHPSNRGRILSSSQFPTLPSPLAGESSKRS
ncbi:hypothetical protein DFH06DRAFT_1174634 [Mycena polygramma]|nr:hypothetical protein DFH06DRAFT_1174634 [Mycena polygramma]